MPRPIATRRRIKVVDGCQISTTAEHRFWTMSALCSGTEALGTVVVLYVLYVYTPDRVRPREHKRLDSHVRHFGHDLLQKKIANILPREATLRHSHKKMRYALPLDILANTASPKLAT